VTAEGAHVGGLGTGLGVEHDHELGDDVDRDAGSVIVDSDEPIASTRGA
jgi:hypothetical protein